MSAGKKLVMVSSVLVTGLSSAMFFSKEDSPLRFWRSDRNDPFAQHVERRVGNATWTPGPLPSSSGHLPLATAAISHAGEPSTPVAEAYSRNLESVGSLLPPIEGVPDDASYPATPSSYRVESRGSQPYQTSGERTHRVEDGDTLTRISQKYLGRADGYRKIYDLNREILTTPDLLPIGAVLRIPASDDTHDSDSPLKRYESLTSESEMVPVPPRPTWP